MKGYLCAVLFVALMAQCRAKYTDLQYKILGNIGKDWGHLDNCGDAAHNFTFRWSPSKFTVGDTLNLEFHFVAQTTIKEIIAHVTVWARGIPQPIIDTQSQLTCQDVKEYLPQFAKNCPLKKGKNLPVQKMQIKIPDTIPIPAGTFTVKLVLKDQDGQLIICAKGDVTTKEHEINWDDWRK